MFESPVKIADLIKFVLMAGLIVMVIVLSSLFDKKTKIVFCNVGQGDATYIRIDNLIDVLIDAGPDKSVLSCLGKYMPFWDREIELAFLSHPNDDHYGGFNYIADRYKIDRFYTVDSTVVNKTYKELIDKIMVKGIPITFEESGQIIRINQAQFELFWPPKGLTSSNDNDFSHVLLFEENGFRLLFTGDASPYVLDRLSHGAIGKIDILKIPHHGSKNGLTKTFLDLAEPRVAVISVGKGNLYGHPHKEVLDMLKAKNVKTLRTDQVGDVVFYE